MAYLAYHFTVSPPQPGSEIISALISDFGFESFVQHESGFDAYIQEELAGTIDISELDFEDFTYKLTIEKIETTNWNKEWEKNFEPVVVDNLLCIRAPFHAANTEVKFELIIMPKMSFGTGHHQTTRLMCKNMFDLDFKNKRVLDMGCGTGILAVLSKKLGAADVVGIDNDAWSVENSLENCVANNCNDILIRLGDAQILDDYRPFDVIIANINKNILKRDLALYVEKLNQDGFIFLSGFFVTDIEDLKEVAKDLNLEYKKTRNEDEWAMLVFQKR